jgi:acetyl-CoA acetyltransferase
MSGWESAFGLPPKSIPKWWIFSGRNGNGCFQGRQPTNVILIPPTPSQRCRYFHCFMDRDVFILSAATAEPAEAIRQALENIDLKPSRVQDAVFGLDKSSSLPNVEAYVHKAGLTCPTVVVSAGLRAIFFAAQSILSGDLDIAVVIGLGEKASTALMLASPDAVGRYNLLPRARLAARSLNGMDTALHNAGLVTDDIAILKPGKGGALQVKELLEELEQRQAQWGLVSEDDHALLVERI